MTRYLYRLRRGTGEDCDRRQAHSARRTKGASMLDLNHYRAPSRAWEWIESNTLAQTLVLLCLAAVVAAQLR